MLVTVLKWMVVLLAFLNAGFMTFDGTRALLTGDYVRPKTGEYAGQLGPWTRAAEKVGIDPMSTTMKLVFVAFGLVGLFLSICFAIDLPWAWKAMLVYNVCASWYLFMGTVSSVVQIILLLVIHFLR